MKRQALVVGLGQFGLALSRSLTANGVEVLAIDRHQERVRRAADDVASALCLDATDEEALARARPGERDVCVCAIGDEGREAGIVVTALFRQLGAKRVVARATDALHERILRLVGADEVVSPEQEFGRRFATHLLYASIQGEVALGDELVLSEVDPPAALLGRTLAELELPRRHGVTVVAIRREDEKRVILPEASRRIAEGDLLLLVSRPGAVRDLMEKLT